MSTQEWGTTVVSGHRRAEGREAVAAVDPGGPDHTLALELVRVTEAAAIAAGRWAGRGERGSGRLAATGAMRELIMSVPMRGVVVVGEQEATPALAKGEGVGYGDGPACDVGIGVGDAALSSARDVPHSLAAIAVAERGALFDPSAVRSMQKLAVGPDCAGVVDIRLPVVENLRAVATAKDVPVTDVVVGVLNRPWHADLVHEIRRAGARVHPLEGGDLAGAVAVARPESRVDVVVGTGGAAEGVLAAAALSCLGGSLQVRLRPEGAGRGDRGEVLHTGDLVRGGSVLFCATGVTGSELLTGVEHRPGRIATQSIVLCSRPRSVRMVRSERADTGWREQRAEPTRASS
ncbi:class II fructose-bisphosphatase [Amycolatopsis endophytica]|uniref:Fructose-1,6-bisphosphatase n=1 Tax=Amycolatopsis endophytica TaxID=860233 RepID=A0A853B640_9PSEU|nr:fructose-bisphosphatase class II [Amycolatopsis endophytica]NYI90708.1 fructose-1,6-bisphosphatase II [Amycolatopsis endophytica]